MNLYSYKYKDTIFDFRMSYGAKLEIEKIQNMSYKVFEDKEVTHAVAKIKSNKKLDDLPEDVLVEVLPVMGKMSNIDGGLDPVMLGYVLLKNNPKYNSLKKEEYLMIVNDMEEKLGFEETYGIFQEMYKKVFRLLEKLQVSHKSKEEKEDKKENNPS